MDFYSRDRGKQNRATAQELLDIQQGSEEDAIALLDDTPIFAQDDRDQIIWYIHHLGWVDHMIKQHGASPCHCEDRAR